jgi:pimeloyl-ACP methyl ester carboxylesterase
MKSIKKRLFLFAACCLFIFPFLSLAQTPPAGAPKTLKSSGYAPVNGLKMYYEIHGEGKPVVLLHGSFMNIDMNWGEMIPELAKTHQVIAVEMQGHGRTTDANRDFAYPQLADDVAGLMKHIKIDSADIIGYSLGGTVAFALAIRHPNMVNRLVIISSVFKMDGWIKPARDLFATLKPEFFDNTPLKTEYDRLSPDKGHWKDFVNKLIKLDNTPFDLGASNIKAIKSPMLLIKGDNDGVSLEHTTEMYSLFDGGVFGDIAGLPPSQLAILPGMMHVTLMMQTQKLSSIIDPYLDRTLKKQQQPH